MIYTADYATAKIVSIYLSQSCNLREPMIDPGNPRPSAMSRSVDTLKHGMVLHVVSGNEIGLLLSRIGHERNQLLSRSKTREYLGNAAECTSWNRLMAS